MRHTQVTQLAGTGDGWKGRGGVYIGEGMESVFIFALSKKRLKLRTLG